MNNIIMIVSMIGTISAILFAMIAFFQSKKKDDADGGKQNGILMTEIGYIKKGIEDIQRKQEKQDSNYITVVTRITAVEASTKSAHARIDTIEDRTPRKE